MVTCSRGLLAAGLLLVFLVGGVSHAGAHAALVRSDPPPGAVLPDAPSTIRLWFTEPLEARYTQAQLLKAAGEPVAGVSSAIAPDDDHQLVVTLPADLPDGGYTVAWRNLSAADGHTLEGYFGIRVGAGTVPDSAPGQVASTGNDTARALTRALALIGLTALLAIAPVTLGVLDPSARAVPGLADRLAPRLRRYALAAAGVALLGSVAALVAQAVAVAPDAALPTAVGETLSGTRYGRIWLIRILGLLLVTVAVVVGLWGRTGWRRAALTAGTVIGLGVPVPFSLLSHAAAQPRGADSAMAADALHLLAAAIWGGGLLLLAVVLVPALRPLAAGTWRAALQVAISRFSVLGLAAWGILLLSGLYSAWLHVGSLEALSQTPYGQSLLLKGTLLVPVLALAAVHLLLGWRGAASARPGRVAVTFALEALLIVAVLLVVGRLIGQPPAREVLVARTPTQLQVPVVFATNEGERTGQLAIVPGAAGINTFTLDLAGAPLPVDAEGIVRFALQAANIGQQELRLPRVAPNRFAAEGSELALAGEWEVTTIVRAIGAFSWWSVATVTVGETPPPAAVVNPAPSFGPAGIAGMIAVAIGLAALAVAVASRGTAESGRAGAPVAGVAALAIGFVILSNARIPVAAEEVILAGEMPVDASPALASPAAMTAHDHHLATPETPGSATLPGMGTPASEAGLVVTLDAVPLQPGPTDLTISVMDQTGAPVSEARVVVFSEMTGMGQDSQGLVAMEEEVGRYRVEGVPLSMSGPWQLTARISPKGRPTSIVRFAVEVP
jgi:copper transport protein